MLGNPVQFNNFVSDMKSSAPRGGFGVSSSSRTNLAHQRSGTGKSTRVLGLDTGVGGAVAGAAEAAIKYHDKTRQLGGLDNQKRVTATSGANRGSSYALGTMMGSAAQSSSVIIGKKPDKYRASSGSRPTGVGHNIDTNVGLSGHYSNSLKPHHNLITGTSTFGGGGGGILSVLKREGPSGTVGIIQESRSSNLQNAAMYGALSTTGTGVHHPPTTLHHNLNLNKSIENQQNYSMSIAERKYTELMGNFKKREKQQKEMMEVLAKKLKAQEKKSTEETKISIELKKRHDIMQKKLSIAQKEKNESSKQLKQLYIIFTKQRKALELSIKKNKKFEFDQQNHESALKEKERSFMEMQIKVDQLEQQKELMQQRHRLEIDNLNHELQEKRMTLQRFQNDLAEGSEQKIMLKNRLDEYEDKIKTLIKEFEDESKRHISEMSETHEQYRGYKTQAQELEQRIQKYQQEAIEAQKDERKARRELVQLTFENDEIDEKCQYLEQKYHALIKRMGASQEDIDAIEEEIMLKNEGVQRAASQKNRMRGQANYPQIKSRVSGPNANMPNPRGVVSNNYVASILNPDEEVGSDGANDDEEINQNRHSDDMMMMGNSNQAANRYRKVSGIRANKDGHQIPDNDIEGVGVEEEYQSMPEDRESQNQSRLEHIRGGRNDGPNGRGMINSVDMPGSSSRNQGGIIQGNHHSGGMVDSYEIYGENHADDSELEMEEEIVSYPKKRLGAGQKTAAGNRGGAREDDIMISGEQIIEPSKLGKGDYEGRRRRTSSSKGQRRISQKRESSGVKKTNIEVLDHETPIEEYQQYYQEQQDSNKEMHQRQMMPVQQHSQQMQQQLEPIELDSRNDQMLQRMDHSQQPQNNLPDMQNTLGTESNDLFNNILTNLNTNQSLQNEYLKQQFKLELIKDEEDLHNYKNLLNAMAAIFFTNHQMKKCCNNIFSAWIQRTREVQNERGGPLPYKGKKKNQNQGQQNQPGRAVPAIEIDTELANAQYENQHDLELQMQQEGLDEMTNGATGPFNPNNNQDQMQMDSPDNLINHQNELEDHQSDSQVSESRSSSSDDPLPAQLANDPDAVHDHQVKKFLKNLQTVGPFSKQILNYSYPPLLYQRGDDSSEEEGDDEDGADEFDDEEISQQNESLEDAMGDLRGRELGDPDDLDHENADLRQQELEELGIDGLDGMDDDAENKQLEHMIDGLFAQNGTGSGGINQVIHEPGAAASPGPGIENVDVSDIQKMINRSGESASPELNQLDQDMLDGLQLDGDVLGDPMGNKNLMIGNDYVEGDQDFYNNLNHMVGQHRNIDQMNPNGVNDDDDEDEDDDNLEPEIAMGDINMNLMGGSDQFMDNFDENDIMQINDGFGRGGMHGGEPDDDDDDGDYDYADMHDPRVGGIRGLGDLNR